MSNSAAIGQTIQRVRRQKHLSVEVLASRAGIKPSTLRRIERGDTGKPHEKTLRQIETGADLPAGYLQRLKLPGVAEGIAAAAPQTEGRIPLAFGHSLFAAPLIWTLANKRVAARELQVASYADLRTPRVDKPMTVSWQSISNDDRAPDGTVREQNLLVPRLDVKGDDEERHARGISRVSHMDVRDIDPLFGPRIRDMWLNHDIHAALTMREVFADLCALAPESENSAIHCASISRRRRGCQLVVLINPAGHYAKNYLEQYLSKLDTLTSVTGPGRYDLALDFIVRRTFEPRWTQRDSKGSRDHLCLPSQSNAKKQASSVAWFDDPAIRHHELVFASFGCLWDQIRKLMTGTENAPPAHLAYVVLWEPLATWVRHYWAAQAYDATHSQGVAGPVMLRAGPGRQVPVKWHAGGPNDVFEYAWSVETPLEALSGLADGSPVLPSISMNLFFRNSLLRDHMHKPGVMRTAQELVSDLGQVLLLFKDSLYHAEFIDQTAAYLSMPRGRCKKALSEIEFQLDLDIKWLDLVKSVA